MASSMKICLRSGVSDYHMICNKTIWFNSNWKSSTSLHYCNQTNCLEQLNCWRVLVCETQFHLAWRKMWWRLNASMEHVFEHIIQVCLRALQQYEHLFLILHINNINAHFTHRSSQNKKIFHVTLIISGTSLKHKRHNCIGYFKTILVFV